jgi:peptidoglycan hydrolase FlgJ
MQAASGEWRMANGGPQAAGGGVLPLATRHSPLAHADKARKTARDFEAMFLEQMLERVFASTGEEGPLGENGSGGGIYRSMLVKEYAGGITKAGGLGIADSIYRELMQLQEGAHGKRS